MGAFEPGRRRVRRCNINIREDKMKPITTGIVGATLLAMTAVSAQADCAAELARLTEGGSASGSASEGISKDGSLAPLEDASDAATTGAAETAGAAGMNSAAPEGSTSTDTAATGSTSTDMAASGSALTDTAAGGTGSTDAAAAGGERIAKDGSHTPLEDASGQQAGVAMSGADAQAQQEGQPTAAEQATGDHASAGHSADAGGQSARDAHVQAARDALAAGDEDACMQAVQAAQSS